jgi:hypothetical protein
MPRLKIARQSAALLEIDGRAQHARSRRDAGADQKTDGHV